MDFMVELEEEASTAQSEDENYWIGNYILVKVFGKISIKHFAAQITEVKDVTSFNVKYPRNVTLPQILLWWQRGVGDRSKGVLFELPHQVQ